MKSKGLQKLDPELATKVKRIVIEGHRKDRTISCPYCSSEASVSLIPHLRKTHPREWEIWTEEMVRLYGALENNYKHVAEAFSNSDGRKLFTQSVVRQEIFRKMEHGVKVKVTGKKAISRWEPSAAEYSVFTDTVWDVPKRGTWGVHQSTYRGNWAPQIPRALLELYTKPGQFIVDPFVGGGTTLLEAWSLGRHATGFDVSDFALEVARARLDEMRTKASRESLYGLPGVKIEVRRGDARELPGIESESVDFIATHPPYGDALPYTHNNPADLSSLKEPVEFMDEIANAGRRWMEVLKPGRLCAVLIGDQRKEGKLRTFGFETVDRFRKLGFIVEDLIVKTQHQDTSTNYYWHDHQSLRLRLRHEYLIVFRKPGPLETVTRGPKEP